MPKLKLTVTVEYDATDENGAYGTSNPLEMAAIDCKSFYEYPQAIDEMLQNTDRFTIRVEPV